MYKTQLENFLLGDNVSISVMKERGEGESHYALLKIGLFGFCTYAVCALGEDYALESIGSDADKADRLFESLARECVSPIHMFDVVSDMRREQEL